MRGGGYYYAPGRRINFIIKRWFCRPSVRPSVAYIANNWRTRRFPTCDATRVPVSRSKVKVTRPINGSATGAMTLKFKVARSRDQSEPSWTNAVPVSLEAGGGIPCRPNPAATLFVFSLCPVVPMSVPMSCANVGISFARTNTGRNSMKFTGGNHYQSAPLRRFHDSGAGYKYPDFLTYLLIYLPPTDELITFWAKLCHSQKSRIRQKIRIDIKPVLTRSE